MDDGFEDNSAAWHNNTSIDDTVLSLYHALHVLTVMHASWHPKQKCFEEEVGTTSFPNTQ